MCAGLAATFAKLITQPRDLQWYIGLGIVTLLEWIGTQSPRLQKVIDILTYIANISSMVKSKYVRYGPNRLSINSPAASWDLHSVNSNTFKADVYGSFKRFFGAEMSMTTVDHKTHAFRRRVNVQAMTPAAVSAFEHLITPHVDEFVSIIGEDAGSKSTGEEGWSSPKDMATAVAFCISDMMGSMTFGRTWNVQKEEHYRSFVKDMPKGVAGIHLVGHMQSLFFCNIHELLFKELIQGVKDLMDASVSLAVWRLEQKNLLHGDIWSSLLASRDADTGAAFTQEELISEAGLFIIGGTDTMITAITSTLFYLLHNQRALDRLTREIREAFPLVANSERKRATGINCPIRFASKSLQKITYLPACIDEAMRISPPIPGILPRVTGPGGLIVDGEFFPAGVNLGIPHYSLHRNEEYFPQPLVYAPERWLAEDRHKGQLDERLPPLGKETEALQPGSGQGPCFTPFGAGRASCIGKHLAYQDMSYILARLVWMFDMRLDPESTLGEGTGKGSWGRHRKDEFQLSDCFVSSQNGPMVQFRYREELTV
ncbi:hypothetical protein S7711_03606 [Stachybotrys chartarum IBT 7711]|uniref:Cytochrome P450 n=1 Tax=Stachybotrys chartarum (strain CBS 109288 / IBT 7711) TaxID=1280523 RepID=A0A084AGW1_STACB|nr:hypothetical protein S7711_03606 [Stachybotrys chartarum IBT 7711]